MLEKLYNIVTTKTFTIFWWTLSLLTLGITSYSSFTGLSLLFLVTFYDSLSDLFLNHFYATGISRRLIGYNIFANIVGVIVSYNYQLYGAMFTSVVGMVLLSHKVITWDKEKDGKITHYKRQEITIVSVLLFLGIVVLGVLYGVVFGGKYPWYLAVLNVLVFCLGTGGRIMLINGKVLSKFLYIGRSCINIVIFILMVYLGLTVNSFYITITGMVAGNIILFKSTIVWLYKAKQTRTNLEKVD